MPSLNSLILRRSGRVESEESAAYSYTVSTAKGYEKYGPSAVLAIPDIAAILQILHSAVGAIKKARPFYSRLHAPIAWYSSV